MSCMSPRIVTVMMICFSLGPKGCYSASLCAAWSAATHVVASVTTASCDAASLLKLLHLESHVDAQLMA
jgi:hypothetical protein